MQQRLHGRGVAQEGRDGLQQAPAVVLRVAGRPQLDALHAVAHLRDDARHVGGAGAEV